MAKTNVKDAGLVPTKGGNPRVNGMMSDDTSDTGRGSSVRQNGQMPSGGSSDGSGQYRPPRARNNDLPAKPTKTGKVGG